MKFDFPIKQIAEEMKIDKGNLSSYMGKSKPVSMKYVERIADYYKIDLALYNNITTEETSKEEYNPILQTWFEELKNFKPFCDWIDERVNEANKKLQMIDYNEEMAKIRKEIEKQRNPKPKKATSCPKRFSKQRRAPNAIASIPALASSLKMPNSRRR